jgi:hypothetical protein
MKFIKAAVLSILVSANVAAAFAPSSKCRCYC